MSRVRFGELWVEKYRPKRLDEMVDQRDVVERLKEFVKAKSMPHLLFVGPPGCGKTTAALCLAYELYGDKVEENVLELNASDERGIAMIREKVKEFARMMSTVPDVPFKMVILDEADNMTSEAQQALRRIMEEHSRTTRFCLIANYLSGIIEPIQSRCAVFRFSPLPKDAVFERLRYIAKCEGFQITDEALEAIWDITGGDMRKAINLLQAAAALTRVVDEATVYRVVGRISAKDLRNVIQLAVEGKVGEAAIKLLNLMTEHGISGVDLAKLLHRELIKLNVPEYIKPKLADLCGEFHYRVLEGSSPELLVPWILVKLHNIVKSCK